MRMCNGLWRDALTVEWLQNLRLMIRSTNKHRVLLLLDMHHEKRIMSKCAHAQTRVPRLLYYTCASTLFEREVMDAFRGGWLLVCSISIAVPVVSTTSYCSRAHNDRIRPPRTARGAKNVGRRHRNEAEPRENA